MSAALIIPAFALDAVSVTKSDADSPGILWELRITGRVDNVTIENVIVNRGCKAQSTPPLPQTLKFGETHLYGYYRCDPIEVQVATDQGNSTFTWDEFTQESVSVSTNDYLNPGYMWQLVVRSHADSLTIKDIVVNRGNCQIRDFQGKLPQPLKFGQRYIGMLLCKPMEVRVITDQGSPTFLLHK